MNDFDPTNSVSSLSVYRQEDYLRLIEAGRHSLDDSQIGVLFALYEGDTVLDACLHLGVDEHELEQTFASILDSLGLSIPEPPKKRGELKIDGSPRLRRIANAALLQIIRERDDLNEAEVRIIKAAAESTNQIIAANSLGMDYKEFINAYLAIRRSRGF